MIAQLVGLPLTAFVLCAGRAASDLTTISGKTGTTQTGNPNEPTNAWFIAFAPAKKPKLAVAVMLIDAEGDGGEVAAPIAREILSAGLQ